VQKHKILHGLRVRGNIEMDSQYTGDSVDWNHLVRDVDQRRGLLNTVSNLRA
jgi:hypothetical protein